MILLIELYFPSKTHQVVDFTPTVVGEIILLPVFLKMLGFKFFTHIHFKAFFHQTSGILRSNFSVLN